MLLNRQARLEMSDNAFNELDNDTIPEIEFSLESIDYIDCDRYYYPENSLVDAANSNDLTIEKEHLDGIDIYFFDEKTVNDEGEFIWGGRANGIPAKAILIGGNIPENTFYEGSPLIDGGLTDILSHEMGHCLGLYHVFHGNDCNAEVPVPGCREDLENWADCGDFVGDTRPIWNRWFQVKPTANNCEQDYAQTGECIDAGFEIYDNLDLINYMQYTHPQCMAKFTGGQVERMFNCIANNPVLQKCLTDEINTYEDIGDIVVPNLPPNEITQTTLPIGQTIWSNLNGYEITGMITVPNGSELLIQSTNLVFLTETSGITVEKGGILRITNAQLGTNKCTDNTYRWKGITVYAQGKPSSLPSPPNVGKHGYLTITNDSKIERADVGIRIQGLPGDTYTSTSTFWPPPMPPSETMSNGVLNVENTVFRDNRISIEMKYLFNESAQDNIIQSNIFTTQNRYIDVSNGIELITYIDLNKAGLVDIQSNSFQSYILSNIDNDMNAIKSRNTSLRVGGITVEDGNKFVGFRRAVDVYSTLTTTLTEIQNNQFSNNFQGIVLHNTAMANVQGNVFLIPPVPTTSPSVPIDWNHYGIFAHNSIAFDISQNHFELTYTIPIRPEGGLALITVNSHDNHGFTSSIVEENTFCGTFTAATQFERSNTDIQMRCNHYSNCIRDWFLANSPNDSNNEIIDELEKQGDCGGGNPQLFNPLGNEWHEVTGDTWHIVNQSDAQLVLDYDADSEPDFLNSVIGDVVQGFDCEEAKADCNENALDACGVNDVHRVEETSSGKGDYYTALQNNNLDGMISLLENEQAEWSNKWLVGIYTNREEYTQATQTLNNITPNSPSNIAFHQLFATVIQAKGNFSANQEQLIRSYTSSKDIQIATLAEMFLAEYFDETFERTPVPITPNASKAEINSNQESYQLYPNPANDHIIVKLIERFSDKEEIHLDIIDINGEVVLSISVNNLQVIPIQDLPSGIYFTHLHQNGEVNELNKFIIIR